MTSGQGGPSGPEDQPGWGAPPQGWNPPPPQQPYGPPQGQQPPPYGYFPAPMAPMGQGGPPPMERPTTVRAGLGAFIADLILGVVGGILTFSQVDEVVAREVARAGADVSATDDVVRSGLIIGAVLALVIVALQALFIWFAWNGRNWARIVLWVLGGLSIVSGLIGLGQDNPFGGFAAALGVFQLLLALAGVVLLALKPSNDWYRYRGWQRANGQR